MLIFAQPSSAWKPIKTVSQPAPSSGNSARAQSLLPHEGFDPFFRSRQQLGNESPPPVEFDAPETSLNLKVVGLVSGEKGRVTLQTADRQQNSYGIGDEVMNGVSIKSIHGSYIILLRDGIAERLTYRSEERSLKPSEPNISNGNNRDNNSSPSFSPNSGQKPPPGFSRPNMSDGLSAAGSSSAAPPYTPSNEANSAMVSASDLMRFVNLQRVNKDGRIQGYKISSKNPALDLKKFNLQDGDILVKIGDHDLTRGATNLITAFSAAYDNQGASAEIIRNGIPMIIRIAPS